MCGVINHHPRQLEFFSLGYSSNGSDKRFLISPLYSWVWRYVNFTTGESISPKLVLGPQAKCLSSIKQLVVPFLFTVPLPSTSIDTLGGGNTFRHERFHAKPFSTHTMAEETSPHCFRWYQIPKVLKHLWTWKLKPKVSQSFSGWDFECRYCYYFVAFTKVKQQQFRSCKNWETWEAHLP